MRSPCVQGRPNELRAQNVTDQRPLFPWWVLSDMIATRNQALGFRQLGVAIVMNCSERFAFFHAVTDALVKFESYAVIDPVFLLLAAAAAHGERNAESLAVSAGDEAARRTRDIETRTRLRQPLRFVNHALISTLQTNSLPEFLFGLAAGDHALGKFPAFVDALCLFAEIEHPRGKLEAQFAEIRRAAVVEDFDALDDFIRMPGHAPERLVHVRDQRDHFLAHALPRLHHDFRESNGVFFLFHERAGTRFYIQDQRVNALGEFLAHNGSADQADVLNRRSHITKRIDFLVRRRDFRGLPDQAHAAFAEHAAAFFEREIDVESGNGFQFVERSAGVAEPAPADHRYGQTARGDNGSED